jgi:hypothetical protein
MDLPPESVHGSLNASSLSSNQSLQLNEYPKLPPIGPLDGGRGGIPEPARYEAEPRSGVGRFGNNDDADHDDRGEASDQVMMRQSSCFLSGRNAYYCCKILTLMSLGVATVASIYVLALSIGLVHPNPKADNSNSTDSGPHMNNNTDKMSTDIFYQTFYTSRLLVRSVMVVILCISIGCCLLSAIATPQFVRLCHRFRGDHQRIIGSNNVFKLGNVLPT